MQVADKAVSNPMLELADALQKADWSNTPIGNKVLISGAIKSLRAVASDHVRGDPDQALRIVRQMVEAYDSGNLKMESPEIGEPENGVPYHPWHMELLHYARLTLDISSSSDSPASDQVAVRIEQLAIRHLATWGTDSCHVSMLVAFAHHLLRDATPAIGTPDVRDALLQRAWKQLSDPDLRNEIETTLALPALTTQQECDAIRNDN